MPRILDDFAQDPSTVNCWTVFSDRVMGGVSDARAALETVHERPALRLMGTVSLANNGGFIQIARTLGAPGTPPGSSALDASASAGIALTVCGTPGDYFVHLRTTDARAPWQFYAAPLPVATHWQTVTVPWSAFAPNAITAPLNISGLLRLGLVAAKTAFTADLAVAAVALVP